MSDRPNPIFPSASHPAGAGAGSAGQAHDASAMNGRAHERPAEHTLRNDLPRIAPWAAALIVLAIVVLFGALFLVGWLSRARGLAVVRADATQAADRRPVVEAITPRASPPVEELVLPGDVRANQNTAIFAQASGYLKPLPAGVDIGARVTKGEVIAEISAPELDAQLEQSRASLDQARIGASRAQHEFELTESTLGRFENAFQSHAVSQQDIEERRTRQSVSQMTLQEAKASVVVAEAAVKRLTELQEFETVRAPFAGVITARGFDAGSLIMSGDAASGHELFRIEEVGVLRVRINVPQGYAADVAIGQPADLLVQNYPGRRFPGKVARTSGSIDAATRTLRVEVDVPNPDNTLMPGMYGEVRLNCKRSTPALILPTSALAFGAEGVTIAVLDGDRVKVRGVKIGRDFGSEVEIVSGLEASERVANNPGSLADGATVTIQPMKVQPVANPPVASQPATNPPATIQQK